MAAYVHLFANSGESQHQSSCAYHYSFLFSGWWFPHDGCGYVALNGKYNPTFVGLGFRWYSQATFYIHPIRSEMKIRRN